jgi:hypothetical protein
MLASTVQFSSDGRSHILSLAGPLLAADVARPCLSQKQWSTTTPSGPNSVPWSEIHN